MPTDAAATTRESTLGRIADLVVALRPDWHIPGVLTALRHQPTIPVETLAAAMIRRATDPANRTPQLQPRDFTENIPACPAHPQSGRRSDGQCAGCFVDEQTDLLLPDWYPRTFTIDNTTTASDSRTTTMQFTPANGPVRHADEPTRQAKVVALSRANPSTATTALRDLSPSADAVNA